MVRTKIVATIGPSSSGSETLRGLIAAGMDVARVNLSHGQLSDHLDVIRLLRVAADAVGRTVAVLADLPGPKSRTAELGANGIELADGERWLLQAGGASPAPGVLPIDAPDLLAHVAIGDDIVLGDGAVSLQVDDVTRKGIAATVRVGGQIRGRPGIRIVGAPRPGPVLTGRDERLIDAMIDAGVDYIGVSFVVGPDDLRRVRARLESAGHRTSTPTLVAKIETAAAVDALDAIVAEADAVMVARGDLGVQCPLEDVPHLQKRIIRAAVHRAKPVITATQMLESMTRAYEPTRAEVSDVANAVLDGTDALMLSGETAIGVDPVNVVATMRRIATRADAEAAASHAPSHWVATPADLSIEARITDAIASAACGAAAHVDAVAILCCTHSGATARAMARTRPAVRIIGLASNDETLRSLAMSWGVEPLRMAEPVSDVVAAMRTAKEAGVVASGDTVVVVAGIPDSLRVVVVP